MKKLATTFLIAIGLLSAGCGSNEVAGTGGAKQEIRPVSQFTGVSINGSYSIIGSQGSPQKLVISTNENLLPYIESSVSSGVLTIENKKSASLHPTVPQNIWFFVPQFNALTLNGSSAFQFANLKADNLTFTLSGSHRVLVSGNANTLNIIINGDSDVDARALAVDNASVEINGSSTVYLNAANSLKVKINGNGKVVYFNQQPKIEQSISGSGQVVSGFGGIK